MVLRGRGGGNATELPVRGDSNVVLLPDPSIEQAVQDEAGISGVDKAYVCVLLNT